MLANTDKLLNDLNQEYQNLMEIQKVETDSKKLRSITSELNKLSALIKSLMGYINYHKMKNY